MPKISEIDEKPEEYMAAVQKFLSYPRGFFLIAGSNGNGKSFTARAIFEHFSDPRLNNQFWYMPKLNMHWQKTFSQFGETSSMLEEVTVAPLLVLDDIGTRKPSDSFMDFLDCLAEDRYENRREKAMIITTNLTSETMREIMGDRFTSRVASGICIRHDGPDRRPNKF